MSAIDSTVFVCWTTSILKSIYSALDISMLVHSLLIQPAVARYYVEKMLAAHASQHIVQLSVRLGMGKRENGEEVKQGVPS